MTNSTSKRTCFWIPAEPYDEGGFVPALITEDEPGFDLMAGNRERFQAPWYWGQTREQAVGIAAAENARKGLSEQDVAEIVASSLAARQAIRFELNEDGLADLAENYPVDEDLDALLAIEAALPGVSDHPLISEPCAMAVDLLVNGDGEIDGYRIIIHPTSDLNEPWIASPICRVSDLEPLERRVGRPNYDTAEIIRNAVKTANELLAWSER